MLFGIVEAIVGAATLGYTIDSDGDKSSQDTDKYGKTLEDYTNEADSKPDSSNNGWW